MKPTVQILTTPKGGTASGHVFQNLESTDVYEAIAEAIVLLRELTPSTDLGIVSIVAKAWPGGSEYVNE